MKKPLALLAAGALAALSGIGLSAPAYAATDVGDATFFTVADISNETNPYTPGAWFSGNVSLAAYPGGRGSTTSTTTGLNITNGATNAFQLMSTFVYQPTSASEFVDAVNDIEVAASNEDWALQVAVFAEGTSDTGFTTLRPNALGSISPGDDWVTSRDLGPFLAGAVAPLSQFAAELYLGEAPEVLASGIFVNPSTSTSIYAYDGFDRLSVFTPIPTRTISPNPVPVADATSTGITFSGTGWFPGAVVYIWVGVCNGTGSDPNVRNTANVADADGNFTVTITLPAEFVAGTYCVALDDDGVLFSADVLEVLDAHLVLSATAPQLAATGRENVSAVIGITALVSLVGLGLVILAARRTKANA